MPDVQALPTAGFLFIAMLFAVFQAQHRRVDGFQQVGVVGCDQHRGAELVELLEQSHQPQCQGGIHIAGRLVCQQQFGLEMTARAMAARCFSPPDNTGG